MLYFLSEILYTHKQVNVLETIIQTNLPNHNHVIISHNIHEINDNSLIIPRNIIQTGGPSQIRTYLIESFKRLNPNHTYSFYDDAQAEHFVRKHMPPEIIHAYEMMPMKVLKADYFRYISIYILGGVYSDMDTECLRPIDTWSDNYTNVSLIVGVEAEGPIEKLQTSRPLQLCQWTFAAKPNNPILKRMIENIKKQTHRFVNTTLSIPVVMNWTGPGLWSDTVLDYLKEIYHVEWQTLLKLEKGRLIGDVYILPITGFQPSAHHLGAKGRNDAEARVWHYFAGGWKRQLRVQ